MLASPTTVTIDGVAHSLSRINQDNYSSLFLKKATNLEIQLRIYHSNEKSNADGQMQRHGADLTMTTWDSEGVPTVTQSYTVIRDKRGSNPEVPVDVVTGLNAWVTANAANLVAWES